MNYIQKYAKLFNLPNKKIFSTIFLMHNKVWVNGSFDVLHIGHINLLKFASELGNLRVGIDSDQRIKSLKGSNRPFNNQENRKIMLESIRWVSDVVIFGTTEELINHIRNYSPDYMVIGDDYKDKTVHGSQFIKEIIYYPKSQHSTSKILSYYHDINSCNRRDM
jgi:D-beta-D-heptose 7-phosphate kinase/D-beta-D-heptose 1-phosphate adenosyltransferase